MVEELLLSKLSGSLLKEREWDALVREIQSSAA
jgi:hypothetical protein